MEELIIKIKKPLLVSAAFLIIGVGISSCASYAPVKGINIDRIEKSQARSVFLDVLIEQQIEDTKNLPVKDISMEATLSRLIKNGEYNFVGAKQTTNEKFTVFLFEPTSAKYPKLAAYVFKFGDNPVVTIHENSNPKPGKFQYYIEVDDLEYCFGQTEDEPQIDGNNGKATFSVSQGFAQKYKNYECYPNELVKTHYYFRSFEKMKEFTQIFISAFPNVTINN